MSSAPASEYFVHMFEYEAWANDKVLEYLTTGRAPAEILPVFSHLIADNTPWIFLLQDRPTPDALDCSPNWSVDECGRQLQSSMDEILAYVRALDDDGFDRSVTSYAPNGREFRNSVSEILTQILSHGQHHRGQIEWIVERETGEYLGTSYMPYIRSVRK